MQSVFSSRLGQAAIAVFVTLCLWMTPAAALDLFARHQVTVEFATAGGKPLADAEVRVFAPGQPNRPATAGRTDRDGKYEFSADQDGFWTAEARTGDEIARVTVRVGGGQPAGQPPEPLSSGWLIGGLLLLLVLAFGFRILRRRSRQRQPSEKP